MQSSADALKNNWHRKLEKSSGNHPGIHTQLYTYWTLFNEIKVSNKKTFKQEYYTFFISKTLVSW